VFYRILASGFLALAALCRLSATAGATETALALEYKVKAGFLFNFAKFTEWPPACFPAADGPLVIGVFSTDPAVAILEPVLRTAAINGHPVLLKRLAPEDDLRACHLIFLSRAERHRSAAVIAAVQGAAVVTVSEIPGFAHDGGIINFVRQGESVRLEINLEAAERVGLKISSKLAGMGRLVKAGKN
jgi:hypothetical protein